MNEKRIAFLRYHSCTRKVRYKSNQSARKAITEIPNPKRPLQVYRCNFCCFFHVGGRKSKAEQRKLLDEAMFFGFNDREQGCMVQENYGSMESRINAIIKRGRAIKKRRWQQGIEEYIENRRRSSNPKFRRAEEKRRSGT